MVVVVIGFSFSLSASHRRSWSFVVIYVSSTAATVSLLMAAFFGFAASLLLLSSEFCRLCWRCVVVIDGRVPFLGCFFQLCRIVVVAIFSLSAAASLLVDVSIGFCASLPLLSSLVLLPLAASRCCRCRRILVADVIVFGSHIVGGVSLLLSSLASFRLRRWRRLVIVIGSGVTEFYEKLSLY